MLFVTWIAANTATVWAWGKWTDNRNEDPVRDSFLGLAAMIVLNLVFLGIWIF